MIGGFLPYDPGASSGQDSSRRQYVRGCVLHRTIGSWPGDYGVGKNRRHDSPGTFNFLVGQAPGQWVQFYPADVRCSHAAGANAIGPGIEFSGQNGEPLTDWQVEAGGQIITWLAYMYGLPLTLKEGDPREWVDQTGFRGFVNHRGVDYPPNTSYRHFNFVTADEFARMTRVAPTPPLTPPAPAKRRRHPVDMHVYTAASDGGNKWPKDGKHRLVVEVNGKVGSTLIDGAQVMNTVASGAQHYKGDRGQVNELLAAVGLPKF